MKILARVVLAGVILLAGAGLVLWLTFLRPNLPPAEKGRRLAEKLGCFACHGPEGIRGTNNPGRTDQTVPSYEGALMMFATSESDIREWIKFGVPAKRAKSESWQKEKEAGVLKMPAFGERLSEKEIDYLVEFVKAVNGWEKPQESLAQRGLNRAEELGCFGCHGAGGRLARPNSGSLKGYVASWVGPDFEELVKNKEEFNEWVTDGVCKRLEKNPIAKYFLNRAVLKMPAFEKHLQPGDLEAIWAYVRWLREER